MNIIVYVIERKIDEEWIKGKSLFSNRDKPESIIRIWEKWYPDIEFRIVGKMQ